MIVVAIGARLCGSSTCDSAGRLAGTTTRVDEGVAPVTSESSRRDPFPYPLDHVVGVIEGADTMRRVREALSQAGFAEERVAVLHGEADVGRLDVTGGAHGPRGRLIRALQRISDVELSHLARHAASLRSGKYLVGVVIQDADREKQPAVDALRAAGAEFINFYHGYYVESFG